MKRRKKGKQDKSAADGVLGAASAVATPEATSSRQDPLPFASDTPPMTASQNHNDSDDTGAQTPEAHGVAHFDLGSDADRGRDLFVMPPAAQPPEQDSVGPGRRLRAAREARGMDLEHVATRLRLPQRVLQAIEADDYSRIEHGVYLRGYLKNYARLLGLPEGDFAECEVTQQRTPPPLVATGKVSHSRYLYQRYSVPAVYVLLTGLIVGPSVWLATHGGLERNLTRMATLDVPATAGAAAGAAEAGAIPGSAPAASDVSAPPAAAVDPVEEPRGALAGAAATPKAADQPLMASLAPFPSLPTAAAPVAPPAVTPLPAGAHRLRLKLSESSWVEVLGEDGRRLEYGILPAGSEREYTSATPLTVRLGNAVGAEVVLDGRTADLAPYRRANVALFRAFGAKGDIAAVEN